ncbi:MAG: sigma-54 dependent transcriptional regulator [Gemmatimonadales bacterium]|jgi:two-component system response regulator AtoC
MRILIIDDDRGLRQSLSLLLDAEGHEITAEGDPETALERASQEAFDVILSDVRMPGMDGLTFLERYLESGGSALVIMMSAYGGEDAAIEAMKRGAYDYLPKPFRSDEVLLTLRKAEERERLRGRVAALEAELARWTEHDVVADSAAMRRVMDLATRVAPHATTVLITGESGSGKEVVARAIHRMSPRRERPFVAVNCGAIPENLLESELFGHARGAFTGAAADRPGLFEEADGGTLLLDEVGELPPALQVKLLRALQEGEIRRVGETRSRQVDVRVLAATARDLERDVRDGRFREDLFYRLNVVRIHLPSLRERPDDVDGLVAALLERVERRSGRRVSVTPEAFEAIRRHPWPGNVRELENALERAAVLSADGVVRAEAFPAGGLREVPPLTSGRGGQGVRDHAVERGTGGEAPSGSGGQGVGETLKQAVVAAEREAIERALAAAGGNRREAARALGISVRSLFYKLKQLALH